MRVEGLESQKKRDMGQCLHCHKPCSETTLFCDDCRSLLHNDDEEVASPGSYVDIADVSTSPLPIFPLMHEEHGRNLASDTVPQPTAVSPQPSQGPLTPPPSMHSVYTDMVEQAIQRLNDAARRIAAVEQGERRSPRASRLSPFRDISADIQRHSTPLPKATANTGNVPKKLSEVTGSRMPDLWPWLPDTEEAENDAWANHTDPLIRRRFPDSSEAARIEEEDERRARAEGVVTQTFAGRHPQMARLRTAFVCLTLLALLALVIDTVLVSVAFLHPHHSTPVISGPPTLTITSPGRTDNQAHYGQSIVLHLLHFSALSNVYITHDVEEPMMLSTGSPLIRVGRSGSADVSTVVDTEWGPGFHNVEAEDVKSHYTANATLQIVGAGPSQPPHLALQTTELDFGQDIQGANTLKPFKLSNRGGSSISWAASCDKPWLVLTPTQGVFSKDQIISIGVQRGTLAPGTYQGKITFSSNVGSPISIQVDMKVDKLPSYGAVLMITPAVLSFTSFDGAGDPAGQVLVVSNPGKQPLSWSLSNNSSAQSDQGAFLAASGSTTSWLSTNSTSGTVVPGSTNVISVNAHSQNLLPGAYTDTLVFSATSSGKVWNSTQSVAVSLTVQPHCSLTLSTGGMTFTAVANSSNSGNQALAVSASPSCSSAIDWHATSSAGWLTIAPTSGQARSTSNSTISVGVNTSNVGPGTYTANIAVVSSQGQSTQSVAVVVTVQAPPSPQAPIIAAAPLTVNFSTTQGQANPAGQAVAISNTGHSALRWSTSVSQLATTWLGASPVGGMIDPGQSGQVMINVNANALPPGTFNGLVTLNGTDTTDNQNPAGGSPQTIAVQLQVNPPCILAQPSSSALAFTAMQGGSNPAPQSVALSASGNCVWPLAWKASVSGSASWLKLSPASGSFGSGSLSASTGVAPNIAGLAPGTYTTQLSINAEDSNMLAAQGSPQVISVTLTVQQPCQLVLSPASLSFNVPEGQVSSAQDVLLHESGACARPVSWNASGDAGSSAWLVLSPPSGTDSGNGGTVSISVNANTLPPGTYKAAVTIAASGNGSALVQGSPQTISVSVTVTGASVSGVVNACVDSTCAVSVPLPGATVSLTNSAGTQVVSVAAGVAGKFTMTDVPLGTYTVSVAGANSAGIHYVGSVSITVNGNTQNVTVNAFPG